MCKSLFIVLALAAVVLGSIPACAATFNFTASLDGLQETPPNAAPGTGFGTFVYDDVADTIACSLSFADLLSPATAAHIHASAGPGIPGAVIVPLTAFPNATSGSYSQTLAFPVGSVADLKSGLTYVNIHSAIYPGGEIRGQLLPEVVPEPSSIAVLSTGAFGLMALRRRKQS